MLILDENISRITEQELRAMGVRARVVGDHFLPEDAADENIIPLLHRLRRPTLFTHDGDFHRRELWHARYALAWLDLPQADAARYIRAFLRHPAFATAAKREGIIARIHRGGIEVWRSRHGSSEHAPWLRAV